MLKVKKEKRRKALENVCGLTKLLKSLAITSLRFSCRFMFALRTNEKRIFFLSCFTFFAFYSGVEDPIKITLTIKTKNDDNKSPNE
ncbi:CLUMA_CG010388, isoform A [Clunio marinus]|uniref:CLUMA_CG010388, isoform A n=1 Tax=Clunio marinus TaxID=568069 RepID=A0A1J1I9P0_9DIPT|nr:CLUMA_CG010388, isoform A [Clunio marinus]